MAEIEISGNGTLDEDLNKLLNEMSAAMLRATIEVEGAMADALENRIITDVYKRYDPVRYERRSENPSLGVPLTSLQYMDALSPNKVPKPIGGLIRIEGGLEYKPSGEHAVPDWDTADGDDLIGRIENSYPPYTWPDGVPPRRRFWQNFVEEMIEGGQIGTTFMQKMKTTGFDIEMAYDEVERESRDGKY